MQSYVREGLKTRKKNIIYNNIDQKEIIKQEEFYVTKK